MNGQPVEVRLCTSPECALYPLRFGKGSRAAGLGPLRAIKAKCTDCSDGIRNVGTCPHEECVLFPYRLGHRPEHRAYVRSKGQSHVFRVSEAKVDTKYH